MIGCTASYVTTVVSAYSVVTPSYSTVILAYSAVIPAYSAFIPAKAGIYPTHKRETGGLKRSSFTMDSRLRGNDVMRASEYQLTQSLPENLQSQLPSVEEIEQELGGEL